MAVQLAPAESARVSDRRAWAGLAVLVLPCLVVSMDAQVLDLAVPALSADLRPSGAELLWIVDSYALVVAALLVPMGALGDRVGRRRVLLWGGACFALASLLAASASSPLVLVLARLLLGASGATLMPSTLSLVRALFPDPGRRSAALGVWAASFALGGVVGPLVGGVLLAAAWWGAVFLVAVPVMALLLVLGPVVLPEVREPHTRRVDLPSVGLLLAAVLPAVWGVEQAGQDGVRTAYALAGAAGVLVGVAFLRRQARLEHPLLDLDLLRRRGSAVPLGVNALAFAVLYATEVLVSQYLQLVLGMSALRAAAWGVPGAAAYGVSSLLCPLALRRVGRVPVLAAGLVLSAVGSGVLVSLPWGGGLPAVVGSSVVAAVGLAPVYVVTTDAVVASAPVSRAGAASAVSEAGAELGGALGIAVLGSASLALFRYAAPGAGTTLAAAVAVDPERAGRAAAVALAVVEGLGAVGLVGAAAAVLALLGRRPTAAAPAPPP
ncbi:DHA2 family multidrug resistance protein-like MFS transporter [Motilibacter rhizosphaerae]|uniref:DHA2 family multidrug resistance protein-like MFS transporter n=1 Tax=Motilibacter rhizosphaerae TaxID=598652 RepID=A0A4Q7NWS3_9ACTN|nr:MFS transporter [Motilibacter rhizosphaerae]RZS91368.1 DHA2 family multidrug resistance protein-like MFS transporter [Motilibacter rhizosphaerae]